MHASASGTASDPIGHPRRAASPDHPTGIAGRGGTDEDHGVRILARLSVTSAVALGVFALAPATAVASAAAGAPVRSAAVVERAGLPLRPVDRLRRRPRRGHRRRPGGPRPALRRDADRPLRRVRRLLRRDGRHRVGEQGRRRLRSLGVNDVLLAVAVEDRNYDVSIDSGGEVSPELIQEILADDVEPALSRNDWAGAAIAMADGLRTGGTSGGRRRRSGRRRRHPPRVDRRGGCGGSGRRRARGPASEEGPNHHHPRSPTPAASSSSRRVPGPPLVEVDDAIRASAEELDFARASSASRPPTPTPERSSRPGPRSPGRSSCAAASTTTSRRPSRNGAPC